MVDDASWMRRALFLAERGLGRTTPNPVVGACIVSREGVVVGQGAHERAGAPHAEVHALDAAGARARGATLYVTLEPCVHTGRTGPCTERILEAGIARVVAAIEDPDPRVSGRGFARLRDRGVEVTSGIERRAAFRLNQPFFTATRWGRPFVILKAATSLDGYVAARPGMRSHLTSAPANRRAHLVRARVDAMAVGVGTILADDPRLTSREVYRERPLARVVFDRRLRTPARARVFSTLQAGPVIILTSRDAIDAQAARARALDAAGATIVPIAEPGLAPMLRALVPFDIHSVLLEGGATVHAAAWDAGVVDCVQLYVTPHVIGPGGVPLLERQRFSPAGLVESRVDVRGCDVIIEGYVHGAD
ncbi:MAG: bifunctional diaminohydroxyphosphoribosylaminopyrimidine deaminase/5-amino-6-(5-phosphoribosylamino)uracil reductase RibD [Vicinamibacterales bacterium]